MRTSGRLNKWRELCKFEGGPAGKDSITVGETVYNLVFSKEMVDNNTQLATWLHARQPIGTQVAIKNPVLLWSDVDLGMATRS